MSGRILIIDTVATNRILLKVRLEQARYQVTTAGSLNEARLQLSLSRWDLIVIDMSTLGPEAAAFTRALRRESGGSGVPIIGIGRFETARARRAVLEAGADEVLAKPLNDTLLRADTEPFAGTGNGSRAAIPRGYEPCAGICGA